MQLIHEHHNLKTKTKTQKQNLHLILFKNNDSSFINMNAFNAFWITILYILGKVKNPITDKYRGVAKFLMESNTIISQLPRCSSSRILQPFCICHCFIFFFRWIQINVKLIRIIIRVNRKIETAINNKPQNCIAYRNFLIKLC